MKAIRRRTGISQDAFATIFSFSVHQIHQWEQGRVRPLGAMRAYLLLIDRDPKMVIELRRGSRAKRRAA
ncbi:MAG: helix-turn-helix domain-containing protein [Acetobacteraceae bacterium]